MRKLIILCVALMMISSIPTAMAITVDGNKSIAEWDENWAFGQEHASTYPPNGPFGDRTVIRQGAYDDHPVPAFVTNTWYDTDPKNDSGPGFDESMATRGESSGCDISKIYTHYDPGTDTLYGLYEVYGMPGDVDGNEDINSTPPADIAGTPGPAGFGIGPTEVWHCRIIQVSTGKMSLIVCQDNDWKIDLTDVDLVNGDVDVKFTTDKYNPDDPDALPKSVYEISIADFSTHYDLSPGQVLAVEASAGSSADGLGEDYATHFVRMPDPAIDIEKYVQDRDGKWLDADSPRGPRLLNGTIAYWKYVVTNTGDEPLENIAVDDDIVGSINCPKTILNVSESMTCFESGSIPDDCPDYKNWATVEGFGVVSGTRVTDEDPAHYYCEEIPALTPTGLLGLIGVLGMIGIFGVKRRD